MSSLDKRVYFDDYVFFVDENVYEPAEDSFLFAENLEVEPGERVLDIGTGSGILAILAATSAESVVGVDINPHAIRYAKKNARINNLQDKIFFVQGDLFGWLNPKTLFDVILFNAPYLPVENCSQNSWIERAWSGGSVGRQVIDRFVSEASNHLKPTGRVLLTQSTLASVSETVHRFRKCNFETRILAHCSLPFFETLVLMEARFETCCAN
jgi:release factor glutamine methyltransferase